VCKIIQNKILQHFPPRHKKKKYVVVVSESEESTNESGDEGEWVEKRLPKDGDDAFVGPVPEIKVQATAKKNE